MEKAESVDSIDTKSEDAAKQVEHELDSANSSLAETAEAFLKLPERSFKPGNKKLIQGVANNLCYVICAQKLEYKLFRVY